ncbi:hypothetical protein JOD55_001286 [Arcanobacterium pluranimalium]|nr:hypothetical protein [Arcanobacterium pluranimalium]
MSWAKGEVEKLGRDQCQLSWAMTIGFASLS